jgi:hypothetical protein
VFRVHKVRVFFDFKHFDEVWIDPHYEVSHSESITDELILELVQILTDEFGEPISKVTGFRYYKVDVMYQQKLYRLILVRPDDDRYIGVRTAYRRSK